MDVFRTMRHDAHVGVMPNHKYCERLPDDLFISNIWPLLVAPNLAINDINGRSNDCLQLLFKMRTLSTDWKWLVETSAQWASFRVAKIDSRGLVLRGTSTGFAQRRALEVFNNVFTLLTTPRKMSVSTPHHSLIAPFPDISDRCLLMLKSALEFEGDGTRVGDVRGDAVWYIPPKVGATVFKDRIGGGNQLQMKQASPDYGVCAPTFM